MNATLNKRERKAAQLLKHYETCEKLGKYLGIKNPDGKKISVALFKIEREAHKVATAYCNGESVRYVLPDTDGTFSANTEEGPESWENFVTRVALAVQRVFNGIVPAFFVNGDARGYALKIDNEKPHGKALIEAVKLHTDWGGYGILSPEITGD